MVTIVIAATLITCWRLSEGPIDLVLQMLEDTTGVVPRLPSARRYGILDFLLRSGIPSQWVIVASAIIALLLTFVLSHKMDHKDWLSRMAIASVCAIIFTYHRRYDFMVLWFLFAAWLDQLLGNPIRGSLYIVRLAILGLLGLSLWLPVTETMYLKWPAFYAMHLLWLGALVLYVWDRRRHAPESATL